MPPQGHHLHAAGTHSFVPSLDAEEMKLFDVQRVPQNAGNTVEMQVSHTCFCNNNNNNPQVCQSMLGTY